MSRVAMTRSFELIGGVSFCRWHECRGCQSHEGSDQHVSTQWLQQLKTDPSRLGKLRHLVQTQDLGLDLSRMNDDEVVVQVVHLLERKSLRKCGERKSAAQQKQPSAGNSSQIAAENVLRVLGAGNKKFSLDGHLLRVVRAQEWRRLREDGQYQIVPIAEAREMIPKLVAMPTATAAEKSAWQRTVELLPEPSAGRFNSGLLLLRIVPRRNFKSASQEPAITPSQLARMVTEKHWVAIELVDENGDGVAGISYSITTPDSQVYTGVTDANGAARVDNIPAGQCQIVFPDLDKDAYKAA
jgi:hypothetical protein